MTEQESTPKATARLLPLSHWTWIDPMSSTQTTVPSVPIGGAILSSIDSSRTLMPFLYIARSCSISYLFGNLILDLLFCFECRRTGKVSQKNLPGFLVLVTDHSE